MVQSRNMIVVDMVDFKSVAQILQLIKLVINMGEEMRHILSILTRSYESKWFVRAT